MRKKTKAPDWGYLYKELEDHYRRTRSDPHCAELLDIMERVAKGGEVYSDVRLALMRLFLNGENQYTFSWDSVTDIVSMLALVENIEWCIDDDGEISLVQVVRKNGVNPGKDTDYSWNEKWWTIVCENWMRCRIDENPQGAIDHLVEIHAIPNKSPFCLEERVGYRSLANWELLMEILKKVSDPNVLGPLPVMEDKIMEQYLNIIEGDTLNGKNHD